MFINGDLIWPIGSIYQTTSNVNPGTIFGGTWEQITGRFLLGVGAPKQNSRYDLGQIRSDELTWYFPVGDMSGEFRHQLTTNEMPSHRHMPTDEGNFFTYQQWRGSYNVDPSSGGAGSWNGGYTQTTSSVGGDAVHNNMPPYYAVYIWRRIA